MVFTLFDVAKLIEGVVFMGGVVIGIGCAIVFIIMFVRSVWEFDDRVKCPWEKKEKRRKRTPKNE